MWLDFNMLQVLFFPPHFGMPKFAVLISIKYRTGLFKKANLGDSLQQSSSVSGKGVLLPLGSTAFCSMSFEN